MSGLNQEIERCAVCNKVLDPLHIFCIQGRDRSYRVCKNCHIEYLMFTDNYVRELHEQWEKEYESNVYMR